MDQSKSDKDKVKLSQSPKKHFSERLLELSKKSHLATLSPRRYKISEAVKAKLAK